MKTIGKLFKFAGIAVLGFMGFSLAVNDPLTMVVLAIVSYVAGSIWFKRRRFALDENRFLYDIAQNVSTPQSGRWPKTD